MVDLAILQKFDCTQDRLRQVFTAKPPAEGATPEEAEKARKDLGYREAIEKEIQGRLQEHVAFSLKNYQLYAAADVAYDTSVITKANIPLMLYAQGKIDVKEASTALSRIPDSSKYVSRDATNIRVDLPKFLEVNVNLCRSIVDRRLAAQAVKYGNLWPYYKYEARGTSQVSKLRADCMSQRSDIMADQFDHRHHEVQVMRDMFKYGHCVDFVRSAWEAAHHWKGSPEGPEALKSEVTKEGLCFVNPHPSRVFWDASEPLASINSDIGCSYIGFWDVARYSSVSNNPAYWNRDSVSWTATMWDMLMAYQSYLSQFYDTITPPTKFMNTTDIAGDNDRKNYVGLYSSEMTDAGVMVTQYYRKLIPKNYGLGDYPYEVWMRFVVGGDKTVIYAEFLPSTPACYYGLNEDDNRMCNVSMVHQLMPFQDQMTNLFTWLMEVVRADLIKIINVNTDAFDGDDKKNLKDLRERLKNFNLSCAPIINEVSLNKLSEMGINPASAVQIVETRGSGNLITEIVVAMSRVIEMAEKLTNVSQNEQGQPAPREISATETNAIAATTNNVYQFIGDAIDEGRAAKKRIIYESVVNCSEAQLVLPVEGRYTRKTVNSAGFDVVEDESETESERKGSSRVTVIGTAKKLEHDYIFTSRDGSERNVNTHAANTIMQLVGQLMAMPAIVQAVGKEKLYEMINEVFRLSGAAVDLKLEVAEGEDSGFGSDAVAQMQQLLGAVMQQMQALAEAVKQNSTDLASQTAVNQQQEQAIASMQSLAELVKKNSADIQSLQQPEEKPKVVIPYKEAPEDVKRQMELDAGFIPSGEPPILNKTT